MLIKTHLFWDSSEWLGEAPAPEVRQGERTAAVFQMMGETLRTSVWQQHNGTRHKKG